MTIYFKKVVCVAKTCFAIKEVSIHRININLFN